MITTSRFKLKEFLAHFPVISKITVKWGEQDAYQHVNNTVYFKYQEVARLKYFACLLNEIDSPTFDKKSFITGTGIGPIMSETYCSFKVPLVAPDKLLVGSTIVPGDLTKNRYKLSHSVWSLKYNRVVAEGYGTVVSYDFINAKSADIDEEMLKAISKLQSKNSIHLYDNVINEQNKDVDDEF